MAVVIAVVGHRLCVCISYKDFSGDGLETVKLSSDLGEAVKKTTAIYPYTYHGSFYGSRQQAFIHILAQRRAVGEWRQHWKYGVVIGCSIAGHDRNRFLVFANFSFQPSSIRTAYATLTR